MSSTAPEIRPPIATRANGTRYHVGRMVVRAPIGSAEIAPASFLSEALSSTPYTTRMTTGRLAPKVDQNTTPPVEALRGR